MQVHAAALQLDLVNLALAVVLAAGLERQQLRVSGQALQRGEHLSYRHAPSVATRAPREDWQGRYAVSPGTTREPWPV